MPASLASLERAVAALTAYVGLPPNAQPGNQTLTELLNALAVSVAATQRGVAGDANAAVVADLSNRVAAIEAQIQGVQLTAAALQNAIGQIIGTERTESPPAA